MLSTDDFLRKVIAPEEHKVIWIKYQNSRSSWNESYDTFEALADAIAKYDSKPDATPYIAVGTFVDNVEETASGQYRVKRKQEQAAWFKALAVDIDVGEKYDYKTQKEACFALLTACDVLKIPRPMVVSSGTGIHAWWPFDRSIGRDTWVKMSTCLQAALLSQGVKIDASKIKDPSMVLRAAGTHHKKDPNNWRDVKVVINAPERPVMHYAEPLSAFKEAVKILGPKLSKRKEKVKSDVFDALVNSGSKIVFSNLLECPQLSAIIASSGATDAMGNEVIEPLWRASLGIAKHCEDPESAAELMSSGHPDYDRERTLEKMEGWRGTGPTVCSTFDSMCPGGCDGCPHKGQIVSPAQLEKGTTEVEIENPETGEAEDIELPRGYVRKSSGIFYTNQALEEDVFVCAYFMYVRTRVTNLDESRNDAKIMVDFPAEGVKEIVVDSAIIAAGGNDLRKELAAKQVYIKEDIDPLRKYLMTYLRKLQESKAAETTYSRYGWQKDGAFLCGTGLIGHKNPGPVHFSGVIRDMNEHVRAEGNPETWKQCTRILDRPGLEPHNFAVTVALAAPLLRATGTPSLLVNLYSPHSGSGKTTAGRIGLAAWGNPDTMPLKTRDTENAMYKKLGVYSCFGAYIDELTEKAVDPVAVRRLVMTLQSGEEPDRLTRSTESLREKARWWTPVISSSNHDLHDLMRAHQVTSEAEQLRLFQLQCPRTTLFEGVNGGVARKVNLAVSKNYGHAGPALAAAIVAEGGVEALFERYSPAFEDKFKFHAEERFFFNLLLSTYIALQLIEKYNIAMYDPRIGIRHAYKTVLETRSDRHTEKLGGLDILSQYLTEVQDSVVYFHETPSRTYPLQPTPRKAVARVELVLDADDNATEGMIWLNRPAIRQWCKDRGVDYSHFVQTLRFEGVDVVTGRKSLYKGVPGASASGQTHCVGLDVMSHERLIAAANGAKDEAMEGKARLRVISSEPT